MYYLARFEESALSTLLRESGVAFFTTLTLHSLSMALVVGINIAVFVCVLRFPDVNRYASLASLYRLHWLAAVVVALSGLGLLLAYPAKALTNMVFYLKLLTLTLALIIAWRMQQQLSLAGTTEEAAIGEMGNQRLAVLALLLWLLTITGGRFLAYTNSILLASSFY